MDPLASNASFFWEVGPEEFVFVTLILGGGAAYLTGRAVALTWRAVAQLVLFVVLLAAAVRFIHFALFQGTLLSPQYYGVDLVVLLVFAGLGFRRTRTSQMVGQYRWLYEAASPLSWRARESGDVARQARRG